MIILNQAQEVWEFIHQRWAVQAETETAVVVLVVAATLAAVSIPVLWRPLRQASTIIHEMGHVLAAWATGRRVSGIKLHSDTSGVTVSAGKPRGFGMLVTTLAGYPAPGLLSVLMAWLLAAGQAGAALTLYQAVVAVALLLSRNLIGIVSCTISLVGTGIVWWYADPAVVTYTVVALAIFYAVAGVRGCLDLISVHGAPARAKSQAPEQVAELKQKARSTDAGQAARAWRIIPLPGVAWIALFVAASLASATTALWLLTAPG